jgi:hypothetical protein
VLSFSDGERGQLELKAGQSGVPLTITVPSNYGQVFVSPLHEHLSQSSQVMCQIRLA